MLQDKAVRPEQQLSDIDRKSMNTSQMAIDTDRDSSRDPFKAHLVGRLFSSCGDRVGMPVRICAVLQPASELDHLIGRIHIGTSIQDSDDGTLPKRVSPLAIEVVIDGE